MVFKHKMKYIQWSLDFSLTLFFVILVVQFNMPILIFEIFISGHDDITDLLVKNGADINRQMKNGYSPLMIACLYVSQNCSLIIYLKKLNLRKVIISWPFPGRMDLNKSPWQYGMWYLNGMIWDKNLKFYNVVFQVIVLLVKPRFDV